jgi:deoxyribodipyrimidine photo-lyase
VSTKFGTLKTGAYRAQFLIESVANLRKNLRLLGQDLLVAYDKPESCIPRLLNGCTGSNVYVQGEVTSEEVSVERSLEEQLGIVGCRLVRVVGGSTLFHPEDLPFHQNLSNLPDVFTMFREKVEKQCRVRPMLPPIVPGQLGSPPPSTDPFLQSDTCGFDWLPALSSLLPPDSPSPPSPLTPGLDAEGRGVMRFHGGEDAALQRVQHWMFASDRLQTYFEDRNGMLGEAYSSKLSPWLALGCISPRFAHLLDP